MTTFRELLGIELPIIQHPGRRWRYSRSRSRCFEWRRPRVHRRGLLDPRANHRDSDGRACANLAALRDQFVCSVAAE